jgi:hypothetical protein
MLQRITPRGPPMSAADNRQGKGGVALRPEGRPEGIALRHDLRGICEGGLPLQPHRGIDRSSATTPQGIHRGAWCRWLASQPRRGISRRGSRRGAHDHAAQPCTNVQGECCQVNCRYRFGSFPRKKARRWTKQGTHIPPGPQRPAKKMGPGGRTGKRFRAPCEWQARQRRGGY